MQLCPENPCSRAEFYWPIETRQRSRSWPSISRRSIRTVRGRTSKNSPTEFQAKGRALRNGCGRLFKFSPMNKTVLVTSLILAAAGFGCTAEPARRVGPSYFIDVHEFGPGKVTAAAVADAHRADVAVEAKH